MGTHERIGATDEWYTPKYIFDALGETFDLDVAHPLCATNVPAKRLITECSLEMEWSGFIWMNPPFGGRNGLVHWIEKFFAHANGIALFPDRTSAPWFQNAAKEADAVLFMSPRVKFIRADGTIGKSPANGTVLMAAGDRAVAALRRAESKLGIVMV